MCHKEAPKILRSDNVNEQGYILLWISKVNYISYHSYYINISFQTLIPKLNIYHNFNQYNCILITIFVLQNITIIVI